MDLSFPIPSPAGLLDHPQLSPSPQQGLGLSENKILTLLYNTTENLTSTLPGMLTGNNLPRSNLTKGTYQISEGVTVEQTSTHPILFIKGNKRISGIISKTVTNNVQRDFKYGFA